MVMVLFQFSSVARHVPLFVAHESQHARPPCPSPTPRVYPNMSIESVMPSNHLILCCLLLLPHSIFPSIRVFSNESALRIRWPKYWSFGFSISPSNEHPGLVSFSFFSWLGHGSHHNGPTEGHTSGDSGRSSSYCGSWPELCVYSDPTSEAACFFWPLAKRAINIKFMCFSGW